MDKYNLFIKEIENTVPVGKSFDIIKRIVSGQGWEMTIYFVNGLVSGTNMQYFLSHLLKVKDMGELKSTDDFMRHMPFLDVQSEEDIAEITKALFTGLVPVVVKGIDKVIILDVRKYPKRSIEEPTKEKTLRGPKDGFSETFMDNIALIRRRIRSGKLIFRKVTLGKESQTDSCIVYMEGKADMVLVQKLESKMQSIEIDSTTDGEQTLIEALQRRDSGKVSLNPFPKVRYTQRPDVVAAHLTEGKIAIVVDNTPTVILIPVGIFDFVQNVDDYYFPKLTGNYMKFLRILNVFVILFLNPVFFLLAEKQAPGHEYLHFFMPNEDFAIPIFWQFILLEIAVDGLKLASLNTPDSLGMSLSVIGALILGEFSVDSGWFIPQTILCMAVVALAAFTQPSIELGYAVKFMRIAMLIGAEIAGIAGAAVALALGVLCMACTKNLAGTSYLYPLIPFDGKVLKRVLFRTGE